MNLELFIARRLLKGGKVGTVSVSIVKIAIVGIALGVCVMLLSVFVITGFKKEITAKLSGFAAHLNITAYENNNSYEGGYIVAGDTLLDDLRTIGGVKQIYPYVTKPAILKSATEIHGVILRGVDVSYDAGFYEKHLIDWVYPNLKSEELSNEVLISSSVAGLLSVKLGDKLTAHFVQDPPRVRMFTVKGIYDTGFKEYD
ncbi:MAG: ABC transporter permease [Odoribacter sp.]